MFDRSAEQAEAGTGPPRSAAPPAGTVGTVGTETLRRWVHELAGPDRRVDDAERIEQIRLLEQLTSAAAATQAVVTADFVASQRAEQAAAGVPPARLGQGVAAQVALARRESPHRGGQHVGLAQALVRELPGTLAELRAGRTSEWPATLVARETAAWARTPAARPMPRSPRSWPGSATGRTEAVARCIAYRLDSEAFMARTRGAAKDRRVSLRPPPDTMSRLTSFLPVAQGVAAYATLCREADRLVAEGDPRSRGQIMADTLVERVTGQASADAVAVEVQLVIRDSSLFDVDDEPAELVGAGPIPAAVARDLVRNAAAQVFLRRLFTRPRDGALVAMESRRRAFPLSLRRFLVVRDQVCRTSWCGAPVRHADHVVPDVEGGATSADNGQGLCAACNYAKQAPGWRAIPGPGGAGEVVETSTPTHHRYPSRPPPLPGSHTRPTSPMELHVGRLLEAA